MSDSRLLWILVGALSFLGLFLLLGATDISAPNYGRYQISSWSTPVGNDKAAVGAFVLDTATGETKMVFSRMIEENGSGRIMKNDVNKTFHSIQ